MSLSHSKLMPQKSNNDLRERILIFVWVHWYLCVLRASWANAHRLTYRIRYKVCQRSKNDHRCWHITSLFKSHLWSNQIYRESGILAMHILQSEISVFCSVLVQFVIFISTVHISQNKYNSTIFINPKIFVDVDGTLTFNKHG